MSRYSKQAVVEWLESVQIKQLQARWGFDLRAGVSQFKPKPLDSSISHSLKKAVIETLVEFGRAQQARSVADWLKERTKVTKPALWAELTARGKALGTNRFTNQTGTFQLHRFHGQQLIDESTAYGQWVQCFVIQGYLGQQPQFKSGYHER